jgi:autotransporter translocation and assembly factor TamB
MRLNLACLLGNPLLYGAFHLGGVTLDDETEGVQLRTGPLSSKIWAEMSVEGPERL